MNRKYSFSLIYVIAALWLLPGSTRAQDGGATACIGPLAKLTLNNPQFQRFADSQFVKRFWGAQELKPIVEALAEGHSVSIVQPFQLKASVRESDHSLQLLVDYVGPAPDVIREREAVPKNWWNVFALYVWALGQIGPNARYQRSQSFDPNLAKATTAILEGITERLDRNPNLRRIIISVPSVQNSHLEQILVRKFGFKILRPAQHFPAEFGGTDVVGSSVQLTLER